ncbi:MAG: electron transfer flavoprotein subunit beta/FixA family protein [Pyrodictiaceae archaeon]
MALNIAVLVKASIDPNMMRTDPSGRILLEEMPIAISEYDKNAIEAAVQLKEKHGGKVVIFSALTWHPLEKRRKEFEQVIREALAMGGDEAHVIVDEKLIPGDPHSTSKALAALIKKLGDFDIIITGEASMDMVSSQIAARIAELLGIPAITFVRSIELTSDGIKAVRDLEDRLETVEAKTPVVISVTGEINKPRIPTLLQIRRAFAKPLKTYTLADLGITIERKMNMESIEAIVVKRKNIVYEGDNLEEIAEKIVSHLIEEGILRV